MATTQLRGSKQIYWDDNVNLNNKRITNVADAVNPQDVVTKSQLDSAISTGSSAIHTAVQDLAALKALTDYADKMLCNAEDIGLYRYDSQSTATSNDDTVVRPTNIASDATPGRWIKMSSPLNAHNNLSSLQGGASNEYYHLTSAQHQAATRNANASQNGLLSSTDWTTFNNKLSSTNYKCRETPSGTKNGSNQTFTLANTPISGTEMVFVNGILQEPGAGNDYTISGNTITMLTAPLSTDKLFVTYWS